MSEVVVMLLLLFVDGTATQIESAKVNFSDPDPATQLVQLKAIWMGVCL